MLTAQFSFPRATHLPELLPGEADLGLDDGRAGAVGRGLGGLAKGRESYSLALHNDFGLPRFILVFVGNKCRR